jgi:hypothetical protein
VTFWYESGTANHSDLTPDPAPFPDIFVSPSRWQPKKKFSTFFYWFFLKLHYVIFKDKSSRKQGFFLQFLREIEGSGSRSVPRTYGSGSMRPKSTRIRIRNTALDGFRIFMFIFVDLPRHPRRPLVLVSSLKTALMK